MPVSTISKAKLQTYSTCYGESKAIILKLALRKTFLPVSISITPRIRLTLHEGGQGTHSALVRTTKLEWLHRIINQYSDILLVIATPQLFRDHLSRKRRHPRNSERSRQVKSIGDRRFGRTEKSNGGIDGDHLVVVREISVECAIEGKGNWRCIERLVRLCLVLDRLACQPG